MVVTKLLVLLITTTMKKTSKRPKYVTHKTRMSNVDMST